jgi:hypothetical protein
MDLLYNDLIEDDTPKKTNGKNGGILDDETEAKNEDVQEKLKKYGE